MLSATDIAARVRSGEEDPIAITEAAIERLTALDPQLGAYLDPDPDPDLDRARALAEALARRVSRGEDPGRLAGVPISLKDNLAVAGATLTAGSRALEGYRAASHAHVTERLLAAGAVLLGRTNLDEFGMGASTENSAFQRTRNPWDTERVPGGSSGGSAAAVAAGIVPVALGSETGGSIRQPAALCGITGFKPSWGAVSRRGLVGFASSLDVVGPLAAQAEDAALVHAVIAGHDPGDETSCPGPPTDGGSPRVDLEGLTIALPEELLIGDIDPGVAERIVQAQHDLEEAGASTQIVAGRLPHVALAVPVYQVLACCEAAGNLARYDGMQFGPRIDGPDVAGTMRATRALLGPEVRRRLLLGTFALAADQAQAWAVRARAVRSLVSAELRALLDEFDLIASPTSPFAAFPFGTRDDPLAMYACDRLTAPACLAGLPSVSVPCGLVASGPDRGLPVGLCLTGPAGADVRVLAAARAFEALRGPPERCALRDSQAP